MTPNDEYRDFVDRVDWELTDTLIEDLEEEVHRESISLEESL